MTCYLLFSDGSWDICQSNQVDKVIANHWWPFPLDEKGDSRRTVTILTDIGTKKIKKNI